MEIKQFIDLAFHFAVSCKFDHGEYRSVQYGQYLSKDDFLVLYLHFGVVDIESDEMLDKHHDDCALVGSHDDVHDDADDLLVGLLVGIVIQVAGEDVDQGLQDAVGVVDDLALVVVLQLLGDVYQDGQS